MWGHALPGPDAARYGAFHTSEVPYAMDTLYASDRPFTDADRRIADAVSSYVANFAKTGDPNGAGLLQWAPYTPAAPQVFELGDRLAGGLITPVPGGNTPGSSPPLSPHGLDQHLLLRHVRHQQAFTF